MYIQDIPAYLKFGDEVVFHLYSGVGVRGIYTDLDEVAVVVYFSNGGERYRKIIPVEQIEYISLIEKVSVNKLKNAKIKDSKKSRQIIRRKNYDSDTAN